MNYFYGGAFNPMTKAHLQIICDIEKQMKSDDLLIIGITNHDYKTYDFPYELRKKIVFENLKIRPLRTDHEITHIKVLEQNQRTWKFLNENPIVSWRRPLTLVLGEDEYDDLKALTIWHNSRDILNNFEIMVVKRSKTVDEISATKVRNLLKNNVTYNDLQKYITKVTWNLIKEKANNN